MFSRIGAVSIHGPELRLVFLVRRWKKRERLGIGRPGGAGVGPLASGSNVNHRWPAHFLMFHECGSALSCRGGGLHPRDVCSIGRKSNVAVEDGFTQLFSQLHASELLTTSGRDRPEKMLHVAILTKDLMQRQGRMAPRGCQGRKGVRDPELTRAVRSVIIRASEHGRRGGRR